MGLGPGAGVFLLLVKGVLQVGDKAEFLPPNEEFPQQEMNTAAFIARRLEETFRVHLPDSERTYICIHLMGYNAFQAQMEEEQKAPENISAGPAG